MNMLYQSAKYSKSMSLHCYQLQGQRQLVNMGNIRVVQHIKGWERQQEVLWSISFPKAESGLFYHFWKKKK